MLLVTDTMESRWLIICVAELSLQALLFLGMPFATYQITQSCALSCPALRALAQLLVEQVIMVMLPKVEHLI